MEENLKHFPENILELYVRRSDLVAAQRAEIEAHCAECTSCAEIVSEMHAFYEAADTREHLLSEQTSSEEGLVIDAQIGERIVAGRYVSDALPVRLIRLIRRRPITSACSVLGVFVIAFWTLHLKFKEEIRNPSSFRFNNANHTLEIYASDLSFMWSMPVSFDSDDSYEINYSAGASNVVIQDIDGDGYNEVVTLLKDPLKQEKWRKFRVYNAKREIIVQLDTIAAPNIRYRGIDYQRYFYSTRFRVMMINGKTEFFLLANNGRSPQIIVRVDNAGKIVGRLWHYGQLGFIAPIDVDTDGINELAILGMDDTPYPDITHSIITVIQPHLIVGETESIMTPGFGFPPSQSERMFIRLPRSDVDSALNSQCIITDLQIETGSFRVIVKSNEYQSGSYDFEYAFSSTLDPVSVKGNDPGARIYDFLKDQGLVRGTYGPQYFDRLLRAIKYYDGSQWVSKRVMIARPRNESL